MDFLPPILIGKAQIYYFQIKKKPTTPNDVDSQQLPSDIAGRIQPHATMSGHPPAKSGPGAANIAGHAALAIDLVFFLMSRNRTRDWATQINIFFENNKFRLSSL